MKLASTDVIPLLKASLLHSTCSSHAVRRMSLLIVLCLRVPLSTLRIGLPCLSRCCRCSHSVGHSDYLVAVDVKAAVARFTVATWSLLMLPLQSLGSQRLPGRCWSCRCCHSVDHNGYLVTVVVVILVLLVDALPPRLRFLSGQPLC